MAVGFVSCSKDDEGSSGDLVGTWVVTEVNCDGETIRIPVEAEAEKIIFKSDGTFIDENGDGGTWTYENGKLSVIYYDGERTTAPVKKLTSSTLVLRDVDDDCTLTFRKIK